MVLHIRAHQRANIIRHPQQRIAALGLRAQCNDLGGIVPGTFELRIICHDESMAEALAGIQGEVFPTVD